MDCEGQPTNTVVSWSARAKEALVVLRTVCRGPAASSYTKSPRCNSSSQDTQYLLFTYILLPLDLGFHWSLANLDSISSEERQMRAGVTQGQPASNRPEKPRVVDALLPVDQRQVHFPKTKKKKKSRSSGEPVGIVPAWAVSKPGPVSTRLSQPASNLGSLLAPPARQCLLCAHCA